MENAAIYIGKETVRSGTSAEVADTLLTAMGAAGLTVPATYVEDGKRRGRGPQSAWARLMANLDGVDQIVVATATDLPGWTVADLLKLLDTLREAQVSLYCHAEAVGSYNGSQALLDLIAAYRRAKLSQAIRRGQERARAAGRHIGRPAIPASIRRRVQEALAAGAPIRSTARKFGLSPASIVSIRKAELLDYETGLAA